MNIEYRLQSPTEIQEQSPDCIFLHKFDFRPLSSLTLLKFLFSYMNIKFRARLNQKQSEDFIRPQLSTLICTI